MGTGVGRDIVEKDLGDRSRIEVQMGLEIKDVLGYLVD